MDDRTFRDQPFIRFLHGLAPLPVAVVRRTPTFFVRLLFCCLPVFLFIMSCPPVLAFDDTSVLENRVKAAYVYNFLKFIEWPSHAIGDEKESIRVCVFNDDAFVSALSPIESRTARSHPITVVRQTTYADIGLCHVLFVSDSKQADFFAKRAQLAAGSLLTVGNGEEFVRLGGIIGFVLRDDRIRIVINLAEARKTDLKISAKLLELGTFEQ